MRRTPLAALALVVVSPAFADGFGPLPAYGGPTSRLAEVATRAALPSGFSSGFTIASSATTHIARQNITSLQIDVPNFYIKPGAGETPSGGTAAYTASIEYPIGGGASACHVATFGGGQTTAFVASGSHFLSDPDVVTIPNGQLFKVHLYYANSAGIIYTTGGSGTDAPLDATNFTAPSNQTASCGTPTSSSGNIVLYPAAIIAQSTRPAIGLFGDSRMTGINDGVSDATGDHGDVARHIGPSFAYINMASAGDTAATINVAGAFALRASVYAQWVSSIVDEYGINDIDGGAAAATVAANRAAIDALFFPRPVYGTTVEPVTTSTDSWATTVNQTVGTYETNRAAFNALVRAGIAGETNYLDISDMIDPTRSGKWPVNGSANYYTSDGLHALTPAGLLEERSSLWPSLDFNRN